MSASPHITDLKRVEEELRQGEGFYRQLAEGSPDAMWVYRRDIIVYVNRACVAFFGASSADELLGKHPLDFVHPDDREIVRQRIDKAYYELKPAPQKETRWIRLDGTEIYAEVIATLVEYQGEAGAQTIFRDVSERRQIEQKLRKSEANLAAAQRMAHLGSWELDVTDLNDLDKCSSRWSDEFFRILGYEPGQIEPLRSNLLQSIHPDDRERNRNALARAVHDNKSFSVEYRIILPNGSERIVHAKAELVFDKNTRKVEKLVGTIQDITARRQAEMKLLRLSGLLLHSQDNERRRIARDLHDSTGQDLVALAAALNQLHGSIPSSNHKSRNLLSECQTLVDQCIREVRTLSYSLHPPMLDEAGLLDAIHHYVDGFTKRSGIHVELEVSPRFGRLPRDVELALFRVVQEGLTNIHRHSGSLHAKIRVDCNTDEIELEVSDSGRETSDRKLKRDKWLPFEVGVGIPSMRERVNFIGGRLDIICGSRGTTLRVTLPAGGERDEEASHPGS